MRVIRQGIILCQDKGLIVEFPRIFDLVRAAADIMTIVSLGLQFIDDEGRCYMDFSYYFEIRKNWQ